MECKKENPIDGFHLTDLFRFFFICSIVTHAFDGFWTKEEKKDDIFFNIFVKYD